MPEAVTQLEVVLEANDTFSPLPQNHLTEGRFVWSYLITDGVNVTNIDFFPVDQQSPEVDDTEEDTGTTRCGQWVYSVSNGSGNTFPSQAFYDNIEATVVRPALCGT